MPFTSPEIRMLRCWRVHYSLCLCICILLALSWTSVRQHKKITNIFCDIFVHMSNPPRNFSEQDLPSAYVNNLSILFHFIAWYNRYIVLTCIFGVSASISSQSVSIMCLLRSLQSDTASAFLFRTHTPTHSRNSSHLHRYARTHTCTHF